MMVSFVIPAYNEKDYIKSSVGSIYSCCKGVFPFEIVVVNNGSTDNTLKILKETQYDSLRVEDLKQRVTISSARNIGWKKTSGEIIAFIDADVLITKEWAQRLSSRLSEIRNNPMQLTGCRYKLSKNPSWVELCWFDYFEEETTYINGGNIITTKRALSLLRGFDENLETGEDVDLCRRARKKGLSVNIDNKLFTHHEGNPQNLKSFFLREQWHGIGDVTSLSRFIRSKVAVFSVVNTLMLTLSFSYILINIKIFAALFTVTLTAHFIAIFKRFKKVKLKHLPSILFLHILYCGARTLSVFKAKI
ncbi:glycosyltransferase [Marinimicrobium agarilyticum]|uniref:glycosyltransferase n=1 Tax=Marinimicrobium agarilyticum TaxID=306546 RepID=UPI000422E1C2|nr:glycosyltransferase family 2 protein [Marinimicrobium agarilyticum]